jgi:hypothetical protein
VSRRSTSAAGDPGGDRPRGNSNHRALYRRRLAGSTRAGFCRLAGASGGITRQAARACKRGRARCVSICRSAGASGCAVRALVARQAPARRSSLLCFRLGNGNGRRQSRCRPAQLAGGCARSLRIGPGIVAPPGEEGHSYQVLGKKADAPYLGPDEWLRLAPKQEGWWPEWVRFLGQHCGAPVAPPPMGGLKQAGTQLDDASGHYVLQR